MAGRGRGPENNNNPKEDEDANKGKKGGHKDSKQNQNSKDGGKESWVDYSMTPEAVALAQKTTALNKDREAAEAHIKNNEAQVRKAESDKETQEKLAKLGIISAIKNIETAGNNVVVNSGETSEAIKKKIIDEYLADLKNDLAAEIGNNPQVRETTEAIVNSPEVKAGILSRFSSWSDRWPRWSNFLIGAAGGGAVRFASKAAIVGAFGASLPATIVAGGVGGGLWEGIKAIRRESLTYQSTEILRRFDEEKDYLQKAAMLTELEKLMDAERVGGNQGDFLQLRESVIGARVRLQTLVDGKYEPTDIEIGKSVKVKYPGKHDKADDAALGALVRAQYPDSYKTFSEAGKFAKYTDKDKVRYLLNLSKGVRSELPKAAREDADKLMRQISRTLEKETTDRNYGDLFTKSKAAKVGKSILKGVAYGALGGAIGGAIVNFASDYLPTHWFGGSGGTSKVPTLETVTEYRPKISDHFTEKVGSKGVTGAGRDAIHHYLSEQDSIPGNEGKLNIDIERLVYAEDYLKDRMLEQGQAHATEITYQSGLVQEALTKAGVIGKDAVLTDRGHDHIAQLLQTKAHHLSEATKNYMLNTDPVSQEAFQTTKESFIEVAKEVYPSVSEEAWNGMDIVAITGVVALIMGAEASNVVDKRNTQDQIDARMAEVAAKRTAERNTQTNAQENLSLDGVDLDDEDSSDEDESESGAQTNQTGTSTTTNATENTTKTANENKEEDKENKEVKELTVTEIIKSLKEQFPGIQINASFDYKNKDLMSSFKEVSDLLVEKADDIKGSDIKEINIYTGKDATTFIYDGKLGISLMDEISEIKDAIESELGSSEEKTEPTEPEETSKEFVENAVKRLKDEFPGIKIGNQFTKELTEVNRTKITLIVDRLIENKSVVDEAEFKVLNMKDTGGTKVEKVKKNKTLQIDINETMDVLQDRILKAKVDKKDTVDYTDYEAILAKAEEPLKKHFGNNFKFNLVDEDGTPESLKKFFTAKIVTALDKNSKMLESMGDRMHKAGINKIYIFKVTPAPSARTKGQDSLFLDLREKAEDNKKDIEGEVEYLEQKQGLIAEAIKIFGLEKLTPEEIANNKDVNAWINLMNPSKTGPLWNAFDNEADAEKLQAALRKQTSWKRGAFYTFKNWKVVRDEMEALIVSFNKTKSSNMLALINQLDQLTPQLRDKIIKKNRAEGSKFEKNKLELDIQTRAEKLVDQNLVTTETKQSIDKLFTDPAPDNDAKRMILEGVYVDLYKLIYTNEISSLDATIKEYNKKALAALIEYISKMDNIAGKVRVEESVPPLLPTDEARAIFQEVKNSRR